MPTLYGSAVWGTNGTVLPSLCGNRTVMQEPASSEILAGILLSDETLLVAVGRTESDFDSTILGTRVIGVAAPGRPTACRLQQLPIFAIATGLARPQ